MTSNANTHYFHYPLSTSHNNKIFSYKYLFILNAINHPPIGALCSTSLHSGGSNKIMQIRRRWSVCTTPFTNKENLHIPTTWPLKRCMFLSSTTFPAVIEYIVQISPKGGSVLTFVSYNIQSGLTVYPECQYALIAQSAFLNFPHFFGLQEVGMSQTEADIANWPLLIHLQICLMFCVATAVNQKNLQNSLGIQ